MILNRRWESCSVINPRIGSRCTARGKILLPRSSCDDYKSRVFFSENPGKLKPFVFLIVIRSKANGWEDAVMSV